MRITIIAVGSRGDVQPYIGLGLGLKAAGYDVRIATHTTFQTMIERYSLQFVAMAGDVRQQMVTEAGLRVMDAGSNPIMNTTRLIQALRPLIQAMMQDALKAMTDSDAVLGSPLGYAIGFAPAVKLHVPLYGAFVQPNRVTNEFPFVTFPELPEWFPFRHWYNRTTYDLFNRLVWTITRRIGNKAQFAVTGLPPFRYSQAYGADSPLPSAALFGFSRYVVPRPQDWSDDAHITGYWFLDREPGWQPPSDLLQFLDDGPPPVYVGFGSMSNRRPEQVAKLVIEALRLTGQRGVLLSGWQGIGSIDLPKSVFRVDSVPHEWLFPRMAALVHHGGSGTTGAAFRAGMPQIVVPYSFDQPFWGRQTYRLGVGAKPIPRKQLTANRLARALDQAVHDTAMRQRAAELGALIRAEDGVGQAVAVMDRLLARPTEVVVES